MRADDDLELFVLLQSSLACLDRVDRLRHVLDVFGIALQSCVQALLCPLETNLLLLGGQLLEKFLVELEMTIVGSTYL